MAPYNADSPLRPYYYLKLSAFYREQKRYAEAIDVAKKLVSLVPGEYLAWRELAACYFKAGEPEKYITSLESAMLCKPSGLRTAKVLNEMANYYIDNKQIDKAVGPAVAAAESGAHWAMKTAMKAFEYIGDLDAAEMYAKMAADRYDSNAWYFFLLRTDRSPEHLEKAEKIALKNRVWIEGDADTIVAAVKRYPESEIRRLGYLHMYKKEYDKALLFLEKLDERFPSIPKKIRILLTKAKLGMVDIREPSQWEMIDAVRKDYRRNDLCFALLTRIFQQWIYNPDYINLNQVHFALKSTVAYAEAFGYAAAGALCDLLGKKDEALEAYKEFLRMNFDYYDCDEYLFAEAYNYMETHGVDPTAVMREKSLRLNLKVAGDAMAAN